MWRCAACGQSVDDQFDACWKCREPKPAQAIEFSGEAEPPAMWVDPFQETKQADGTITVRVFERELSCAVCGNHTFRERSSLLKTHWTSKPATNFICSKCGYIFWFLPEY